MKRNGFFILLIYLMIYSSEAISQSFTFIQITDPQFGFTDNNKSFSKETQLYEKAVAEINRIDPDFVVITGDLVNDRNNKSQVDEFKRITCMISPSIPVYYSPGNHDIGEAPKQTDIDEFKGNYGHDRFAFRHKRTLLIGLNSCLIKSETPGLEASQYQWLADELKNNRRLKHKIIFCHYPFFISRPDEPDQYFNIPSDIRSRYLELFSKYNVNAVFAGHLHNNGYGKNGNLEMITTSAAGKPLAKIPSGFRIIKVYQDRIESEYISIQ